MKTRMMVLISILIMVSISCQMMTDFLPSGGSNPVNFSAVATSPISVQLTWSKVEGAQKYLVERNDAQTDYFPLAEASGDTTSFEDFLVPADTKVTYRIKTVTASGTSGGKTISLSMPKEVPNPLTVAATFDTQHSQSQSIGPDGGNVSTTDSKGVRYSLAIPAGALGSEVTFTLTPIQDIQGLPLSGGMTSGVRIEPEGLRLDPPATLSVESPQTEPADGMVSIGFAFDADGSEFHFVPGGSAVQTSEPGALKLASYLPTVKAAPGKIWYVPQTRSQGSGRGTSKDFRDQAKNHAPTSPADNQNQKMAVVVDVKGQMVVDALLLNSGRQVELQVAGATGWLEFSVALESFQAWLEQRNADKNSLHKDQLDKQAEAIWEALDMEARVLLDQAAKDCKKSPNVGHAKNLLNRLLNPKSSFDKAFSIWMLNFDKNPDGFENYLKDIKAKLDKCKTGWKVLPGSQKISGIVCDLENPFTLQLLGGTGNVTVFFVPSSAEAGTSNFAASFGEFYEKGNGPYTAQGIGTNEVTITGTMNECVTGPGGTACGTDVWDFSLVPLDTNECNQS